jgi:hypothetical protein
VRPLRAFRKTLAILAIALGAAVGLSLIPGKPYQRWQLLNGTIHANARWMYERIHFDPRPIDVVFVGPSRTGAGVNAPRLARSLAAERLPSNVVNFSLPESGRNVNLVIVQELLKTKQPKLLVIGVTEKPSRTGHSTFKFLAPARMIVSPGYPTDLNYFSDLIYLPYRQAELLAARIAPGLLGPSDTFDPAAYRGPSLDTTGSIALPDGRIKDGEHPASMAELMRGVHKLEAGTHPPILPRAYADLEFGDERHYLREIVALARAHHVKVAFLFLPYYTGPSTIQEQDFYARYGPVWNAGFLADDPSLFMDYGHLTRDGAKQLTDWLVAPVSRELQPAEPAP